MKKIITGILLCQFVLESSAQQQSVLNDTTFLQPVELIAIRAGEKTPMAKTNLSKTELRKTNIGYDLPFILNQTPSVIVNSDAGNGIGYTGIMIRGTDASRINVTINGIPYTDAESQGTFFVDQPDIASSAGSIQVQRGVGTSANGAGAFGGTINLGTNDIIAKGSLEFNNSAGSYHSFRNTIAVNSGLLGKHFTIDARLSHIRSDGYIERAASRLRSFYTSFAWLNNSNSLRMNIFSGKEKTYQAWNGIDEQTLKINRRYNAAGTEKPGVPYDNETDNYTQTHYQFFFNHKFSSKIKSSIAIFLSRGKGYYEQYKADESLSSYGLPDYHNGSTTITATDLVRRLWLDNYFYGGIFSLHYLHNNTSIVTGGGWNRYDGKHFGEVAWAKVQEAVPANYRWYNLTAHKTEFSGYTKWTQRIGKNWQSFVDLQVRSAGYTINGFRDNPTLHTRNDFLFFNPKAGITFTKNKTQAYLSFARAAKEPNRDDFEAGALNAPKAEILNDFESGIEHEFRQGKWGINLYYMWYKNQLILTGKINDVGAYTRMNIPNSYRAGIELQGMLRITNWLSLDGNASFSENKIKGFTEYLDDYDNGGQQTNYYGKTDIAFSPAVVGSASLNIIPVKNAMISLMGKYVGRQYLDNTSKRSRSLHDYYIQDLRFNYDFQVRQFKLVQLFVQVNNVFSTKYEANGYSFSYVYGGRLATENFYYPMATVNFMAGLNIKL